MNRILIAAMILAAQGSFAQSLTKPVDETIKPPVSTIDFDRFMSDMCYMSNCGNVPAAPYSLARAETRSSRGGSLHSFTEYRLPYPAGVSCTSLLGQADNLFSTVLTTGTIPYNNRDTLDIQFNGEGRIQRANANTSTGVGAVGVRVILTETPSGGGAPIVTPLFERWVLHNSLEFTLIDDLPGGATNPTGVNQPVINTVGVRRFYQLQPGSSYKIDVDVKWSDAFTGLTLEPSTISFVTGGGRGALMCIPTLQVAETNSGF
jgi:hypothetical protein